MRNSTLTSSLLPPPSFQAIVTRILPEAVAEFRAVMTAAGHTVAPRVTISDTPLNSAQTVGGVILTAMQNKIVLNQVTLTLTLTLTDRAQPGAAARPPHKPALTHLHT